MFSLFVYSEILTKKKAILIGWLLINIFNLYASSSSVTNNHDFDNRCYNISVFHCIANICIFFIKPIEKFYFGCFYLTSMNMIVLILVIYSKLSTTVWLCEVSRRALRIGFVGKTFFLLVYSNLVL